MGMRLGRVDGVNVGLVIGWIAGLLDGLGKGANVVGLTVGPCEGANVIMEVGLGVGL